MGKKKKDNRNDTTSPDTETTPSPLDGMTGALVFLVLAVAAYGNAAHRFFDIEYAPAFVGLFLFLALVGWTAGGGMGDASRFEQPAGVIGMAVALVILVGAAPFIADGKSESPKATTGGEQWRPSLNLVDDRIDGTPTSSTGGPADVDVAPGFTPPASTGGASSPGSQGMMSMLAALQNMPPPAPEGPPDELTRLNAAERARRFFWGVVNADVAVMEAESSMPYGETAPAVVSAAPWSAATERVAFDAITVEDTSYENSSLHVRVKAGTERGGTVTLTKGIDWEVTGFVPAP